MIISALILVLSLSLLFFYFQTLCQRILRREFDRDYFQTVVRSGALEFATLRQALESPTEPLNYEQCRVSLQCDLLTLRYLLKHAANLRQKLSWQERLLLVYYRLSAASMAARHWLGMNENTSILKMTKVLQYFANVIGERNFKLQANPLGSWQ
ncbi:MAG: hypothetical protein DMG21_08130 [Acidobacteria bacterium]|nr:MAG: hypothetical protein DMG21_08130 [Acidobacteriota bacterium]